MLLLRKLLSRLAGRRQECRHTRPMLEILECRDCPAVQAFFAAGVLSVVGDGGNNVIDLFQPADRVVQVTGDGQMWVFTDVDEVFVDAGDGDDQATSSKPKEIVVVGSKIKMEMGAGNDTVRIGDGGPIEEPIPFDTAINVSVDLGTGADDLSVEVGNANLLNLSVRSADGSDSVHAGHTIGLRHEHTRPEANAQIDLDLAGGGDLVDVLLENIENVDLSLVSQPVPDEPKPGGTINTYVHVIYKGSSFIGRCDGQLQMISTSPDGSAIGISPTSLSFAATAGDDSPSLRLDLIGGDGDDVVDATASGFADVALNVDTGGGDDVARLKFDAAEPAANGQQLYFAGKLRLGSGFDSVEIGTTGFPNVDLGLKADDGGDQVAMGLLLPAVESVEAATARIEMELGASEITGNDVSVTTAGFDGVVILSSSLPGGSSTRQPNHISVMNHRFGSVGGSLALDLVMGDEDDVVNLAASGFETVVLNANAGGGDDLIGWDFSHGDNDPSAPSIASHHRGVDTRATIDLGAGDDSLSFVNAEANSIQLFLRGGEGDDTALIDGTSSTFFIGERPPSQMVVDLGAGNDNLALNTTDIPELELELTTGDGDDSVHTHNQVRTRALWALHTYTRLGAGSDRLQTEIEGDGNGKVDLFIDAGSGNDEVVVHAEANDPQLLVRDPQAAGMVIDLGNGANQLSVETTDFTQMTQDLRGGDGNDQIEIHDRVGPFFQFESKRLQQRIYTGGGNDFVLNDSEGSDDVESAIDLGSGNDALATRYSWAYLVRPARLHVAISLGAGSDIALFETLGYQEIAAAIDIGPAGDGRDLVLGSIQLSPLDRLKRIRRVLDRGQDLVELLVSADYDVQVIDNVIEVFDRGTF